VEQVPQDMGQAKKLLVTYDVAVDNNEHDNFVLFCVHFLMHSKLAAE